MFGYGVRGRETDGWGVGGQADRAGVRGSSTKGTGVEGNGNPGVYGYGNIGVHGGDGKDRIYGGSGNYRVYSGGHFKDVIDCGRGKRDWAEVDASDKVVRCERLKHV
jgi:hypothetical protein